MLPPAAWYFNPRSPHGERREWQARRVAQTISIHAPRTGSDCAGAWRLLGVLISIHAPRTGSDGETRRKPRPARISIHAPRTGSDAIEAADDLVEWAFQSTLPARGATAEYLSAIAQRSISIHAPRTGSDQAPSARRGTHGDFNPRSPHGERPTPRAKRTKSRVFQSTLPARGATTHEQVDEKVLNISIHAPRTGSDHDRLHRGRSREPFQSTLPARGATCFSVPCGARI